MGILGQARRYCCRAPVQNKQVNTTSVPATHVQLFKFLWIPHNTEFLKSKTLLIIDHALGLFSLAFITLQPTASNLVESYYDLIPGFSPLPPCFFFLKQRDEGKRSRWINYAERRSRELMQMVFILVQLLTRVPELHLSSLEEEMKVLSSTTKRIFSLLKCIICLNFKARCMQDSLPPAPCVCRCYGIVIMGYSRSMCSCSAVYEWGCWCMHVCVYTYIYCIYIQYMWIPRRARSSFSQLSDETAKSWRHVHLLMLADPDGRRSHTI